jgi:tetratricopeptide (TPR) repeat protein
MAPVYYATGRNKEYLKALDGVDRDTLHDDGLRTALLVTRGVGHYNRGELVDAEGCLKRALGSITGLPQGACPRLGGANPQVVMHTYMSMVLRNVGRLEEGALIAVANESFARTLDDPFSLAWALLSHSRTNHFLGADESALATANEMITICEQHGFSARVANGLNVRGMALAHLGHLDQGIVDCRRALEVWAATGAVFTTVDLAANLTELLLRAGRIDEAARTLDDVDRLVAGTDEAVCLAECQRLRGMVDAATDQLDSAERWFNEAIITARNQSARLFELRATTRLGELLAKQDRQVEASRRLSEVYAAFTEGHRAPDLQAAKTLLDRLG